MSAISDLTINDGMDTPVTHTFSIMNKSGLLAEYADLVDGVAIGYPTITTRLRPTTAKTARKVAIKLVIPHLKVPAASQSTGFVPAPEVADYTSAHIEFLVSPQATLADAKNILAYVKNLLKLPIIPEMVEDGKFVY
jgi:hypothetical protein